MGVPKAAVFFLVLVLTQIKQKCHRLTSMFSNKLVTISENGWL